MIFLELCQLGPDSLDTQLNLNSLDQFSHASFECASPHLVVPHATSPDGSDSLVYQAPVRFYPYLLLWGQCFYPMLFPNHAYLSIFTCTFGIESGIRIVD